MYSDDDEGKYYRYSCGDCGYKREGVLDGRWYSWHCPKCNSFNNKIEEVSMGNFSEALESLKEGNKIARSGWNGKGMFLFYNPGSEIKVSEGRPLAASLPVGSDVKCLPYIMMKTADPLTTIVPWLASQTDILANDWMIVQ